MFRLRRLYFQIAKSHAAVPHISERIIKFDVFREGIKDHVLHPSKYSGKTMETLPSVNALLKGLRPCELTLFSGHTGTGKTTILSHISLDYCSQGIATLWGSFEIRPEILLKKMLKQFSNPQIPNAENFDDLAIEFGKLPLYMLNFYGSSYLNDVMPALQHAVDYNNVKHIVLDNLQFMLSDQGRGFADKYELQDKAISQLRAFCTKNQVHITVVVHPRKEADDVELGIHSIYGSAKATQEADNIFIVQRDSSDPALRFLDLKKNRYDGACGRIFLGYCPNSHTIFEVSKQDQKINA